MNGKLLSVLANVAPLALLLSARAQAPPTAGTLSIAGQSDQAPLVRINGKSYVDVESLARLTHGTIRFQGSQTILTLPQPGSALPAAQAPAVPAPQAALQTAPQTARPAQLSERFLSAQVEALAGIREWRVALVNAIKNNAPVTESWVGGLRRTADARLQLATAATATDSDQKAAELLRNEFTAMQQMSDQFLAMHAQVNYIAPDTFDNNPLDQKIVSCEHALAAMAGTKQFQDEPSCH